jgi:hypothetical protein
VIDSEAAELLARASAFDNRTIGEADATAWAAALHDLPLDNDTLNAVARYYSAPTQQGETGRRWVEPHHVRTWRTKIRGERLGETIPAYEPTNPGETGSDFIARRRAQLGAIADGRLQPIPVQQLTGGPHPQVARELAAIGRPIPDEDDDRPYMPEDFREQVGMTARPPELRIPCPNCKALARQPCKTPHGRTRTTAHTARTDAAQGATA